MIPGQTSVDSRFDFRLIAAKTKLPYIFSTVFLLLGFRQEKVAAFSCENLFSGGLLAILLQLYCDLQDNAIQFN